MIKKSRKFPSVRSLDEIEKVLSRSGGSYILPPDVVLPVLLKSKKLFKLPELLLLTRFAGDLSTVILGI